MNGDLCLTALLATATSAFSITTDTKVGVSAEPITASGSYPSIINRNLFGLSAIVLTKCITAPRAGWWRRVRTFRNSLLVLSVILLTPGCVLLGPPPDLPIADPPLIMAERCTVTVVRASQWVGRAIATYVTLDGANVAHLFSGEYTTFWVEAGNHTIGIRWAQRWGAICIVFPFCVHGPEQVSPNWFKAIDLECRAEENYSYGIKANLWPPTERMLFDAFTDAGEDFRIAEKTFVQPYVPGSW